MLGVFFAFFMFANPVIMNETGEDYATDGVQFVGSFIEAGVSLLPGDVLTAEQRNEAFGLPGGKEVH